jgi:hypothetical protein
MEPSAIVDQAMIAGLAVWLIERAKDWARLPFINAATDRICRLFSALAAMVAAAGLTVAANWTGFQDGTLTLTIQGLTAANVAGFFWTAGKSLFDQEVIYRLLKASKRPAAPAAQPAPVFAKEETA